MDIQVDHMEIYRTYVTLSLNSFSEFFRPVKVVTELFIYLVSINIEHAKPPVSDEWMISKKFHFLFA